MDAGKQLVRRIKNPAKPHHSTWVWREFLIRRTIANAISYPFTPPAAIPSINQRWQSMNMIRTGIREQTEAAIINA